MEDKSDAFLTGIIKGLQNLITYQIYTGMDIFFIDMNKYKLF